MGFFRRQYEFIHILRESSVSNLKAKRKPYCLAYGALIVSKKKDDIITYSEVNLLLLNYRDNVNRSGFISSVFEKYGWHNGRFRKCLNQRASGTMRD